MSGGRPLKFQSLKELQEKIQAYFAECDPHWVSETYWDYPRVTGTKKLDQPMVEMTRMVRTPQLPYTITGLALALGTTRDLLIDYEEKDEFSDTIKEAKSKVHNYAERALFGNNPTGPIFNLKNNYGWRDKTEQENSGEQKIIVETRVRRSNATDKD